MDEKFYFAHFFIDEKYNFAYFLWMKNNILPIFMDEKFYFAHFLWMKNTILPIFSGRSWKWTKNINPLTVTAFENRDIFLFYCLLSCFL